MACIIDGQRTRFKCHPCINHEGDIGQGQNEVIVLESGLLYTAL